MSANPSAKTAPAVFLWSQKAWRARRYQTERIHSTLLVDCGCGGSRSLVYQQAIPKPR